MQNNTIADESAKEQAKRLRALCVATHWKCRMGASYLDALLTETNQKLAPTRVDQNASSTSEEDEQLLAKRVAEVVESLRKSLKKEVAIDG
ncbi:hypothetical protein GGE65_008352 [Skermanella aerolata]|uniref:hypothetical protein n=1 Tax=Skermanella aerolata TaxID=393310 RepID=UPI003D1C0F7F